MNKVKGAGEPAYDDQDGCVTMGLRELSDEI